MLRDVTRNMIWVDLADQMKRTDDDQEVEVAVVHVEGLQSHT